VADAQLKARVEHGFLVLADVGGYTRYLTTVELDHAQDVLADLIGVLAATMRGGLVIDKLEGDAVFAHSPGSSRAEQILELVEASYFTFARRQRDIDHNTTCTCRACSAIPDLALKFVVHHGEYVERDMSGSRELVGSDVILGHRLLKNTVTKQTGLTAYALFTQACVDALGLDPGDLGLVEHRQSTQEFGRVECWVLDLAARWRAAQERESVYVPPGATPYVLGVELPAPPSVAWDWVTSGERQRQWMTSASSIDERHVKGVRGVGTTSHCVHGGVAVDNEVLDYKPFRYVTLRSRFPFGPTLVTWELTPIADGSRTAVETRLLPGTGIRSRVLTRLAAPRVRSMIGGDLANLARLLSHQLEERP